MKSVIYNYITRTKKNIANLEQGKGVRIAVLLPSSLPTPSYGALAGAAGGRDNRASDSPKAQLAPTLLQMRICRNSHLCRLSQVPMKGHAELSCISGLCITVLALLSFQLYCVNDLLELSPKGFLVPVFLQPCFPIFHVCVSSKTHSLDTIIQFIFKWVVTKILS